MREVFASQTLTDRVGLQDITILREGSTCPSNLLHTRLHQRRT